MNYGTVKTTHSVGTTTISNIEIAYRHKGKDATRTLRSYHIRVKVNNPQDEMSEYLRFSDELAKLRAIGKLAVDKDDPSTRPSFVLHYPKSNEDGSYFIVKCWTVVV